MGGAGQARPIEAQPARYAEFLGGSMLFSFAALGNFQVFWGCWFMPVLGADFMLMTSYRPTLISQQAVVSSSMTQRARGSGCFAAQKPPVPYGALSHAMMTFSGSPNYAVKSVPAFFVQKIAECFSP